MPGSPAFLQKRKGIFTQPMAKWGSKKISEYTYYGTRRSIPGAVLFLFLPVRKFRSYLYYSVPGKKKRGNFTAPSLYIIYLSIKRPGNHQSKKENANPPNPEFFIISFTLEIRTCSELRCIFIEPYTLCIQVRNRTVS